LLGSPHAQFQLAVDPMLRPIVHEPGEVIFEQYASGTKLLFLKDGTAKCSTTLSAQPHMLYTIDDDGELFGEHAILGVHSDIECRALTRVDVFQLEISSLEVLLRQVSLSA
jgi:CRP-like cAMP-binding protein